MGLTVPPIFRRTQFARRYNGLDSILLIPGMPDMASPMTMACWLNPRTVTTNSFVLSVGTDDDSSFAYRTLTLDLPLDLSGTQTLNALSSVGGSSLTPNTYQLNRWNHLAGTWQADTSVRAYLNGVAGDTSADPFPLGVSLTLGLIGGFQAFRSFNFLLADGQVAYPFFWNIPLLPQQVKKLARGYAPWKMEPRHIVAGPESCTLVDPYLKKARWISTFGTRPTLSEPPFTPQELSNEKRGLLSFPAAIVTAASNAFGQVSKYFSLRKGQQMQGEYVGLEFSSADASTAAAMTIKDANNVAVTLLATDRLEIDTLNSVVAGSIIAEVFDDKDASGTINANERISPFTTGNGVFVSGFEGFSITTGNTPKVKASGAGQVTITGTGRLIRGQGVPNRPTWRDNLPGR